MACNCNGFYKLNPRTILSDSVTVVAVDGVDTLLIDIPLSTYLDGFRYNLIISENIPAEATVEMPVAISIGGVTTTVYPLTDCRCVQLVASQIENRTRYPVLVSTNATSGVFKILGRLKNSPNGELASLPILTAPAATTGGVSTNG